MDIVSLVAFVALPKRFVPEPTLWLRPDGNVTIEGRAFTPKVTLGARGYMTPQGFVYDFDGTHGGVYFGDQNELKLTGSMTVALWIHPRSYVNDGPGAQLLFRGDDRCGLDPYDLVIHSDGTIHFAVQNDNDQGASVWAELPLNRWTQVVANWDQDTGFMKMWLDGELVGMVRTSLKPFANLDNGWTPGVGVGNVQNGQGPHNQPFNGMLSDMRLYRGAWTPDDLRGLPVVKLGKS